MRDQQRMFRAGVMFVVAVLSMVGGSLGAQAKRTEVADRLSPPGQTFRDARSGVSFDVPAGWNLNRRDHEVSTFHLDARTAPKSSQLKAVVNINFNPFPASTFSGALLYFSITPRRNEASCAHEANEAGAIAAPAREVAGIAFTHGRDQHFHICVDARDEIYTSYRRNTCLRFDLTINNFCGGEVSGVRDMSKKEIENVFQRLEEILDTVRVEEK